MTTEPKPLNPDTDSHPANPQKTRRGMNRLWHATGYSLSGLRAAWDEPAFRLEAILAGLLLPAAFWLGQDWTQTSLLAGSVVLVMIVELLNSAIEATVDRIGPQWHVQSKRAKDMGSAAVLVATLLAISLWLAALWQRFFV